MRAPQPNDQEQAEKAFQILKNCMQSHGEIEPTLWYSAILSILVDGFMQCALSYEYFCEELENAKKHYKSWFENDH